jgi:hypothetical protein
MDRTATDATIKVFLKAICERLTESSSIATAAEACANAGQVDRAVSLALGFEQLVHEAHELLNVASLPKRLCREQQGLDPCED